MKQIYPSDPCLTYCGRIDFEEKNAPVFVYPSSFVSFRMKGNVLNVIVENHCDYWKNYLGVIIDGIQSKLELPPHGKVTLNLAENLNDSWHEIMLFKRQDACHTFTFFGFEINDQAICAKTAPLPKRKIEVFGDSVSAGEVSEAIDFVGKPDPIHDGEFSNSYYSYAWITARNLQATLHNQSQGGLALLDNTGWYQAPNYIGLESIYDKIEYSPALGQAKAWDFSQYIPHVVLLAVGQNDSHPDDYMQKDSYCEKAIRWKQQYLSFVLKLRALYPSATIILTTTILNHDSSWDSAIEDVCKELNDTKIHHFLYQNNGCGTPGHIRIPEAQKMADELTSYIKSLGDDIWEE